VSKSQRDKERMQLLRKLARRHLERVQYVGCDAVVIRTTEERPIGPADHARFADGAPYRIYPVAGAYFFKWRVSDLLGSRDGREIEPGGWDHTHCDACNRSVNVDGSAWLTTRGSFFKLCPYCYRRVRQLATS
jgi:CRISPR/Cas system-associated endoribonuclease Cas2